MANNQTPDRNRQGQNQKQSDTSRQRKNPSDKPGQEGTRQPSRSF